MEHRIFEILSDDYPSNYSNIFFYQGNFHQLSAILTIEGEDFSFTGDDTELIELLDNILNGRYKHFKNKKGEIVYDLIGRQYMHISDERFYFALYHCLSSYSCVLKKAYTTDYNLVEHCKRNMLPVHNREEAVKLQEEWRKSREVQKAS